MLIAIAAIDLNYGLGKNNKLLYYLPADLKRFKCITKNKTIVIGLNTLKSFPNGKPLPDRKNIVLCNTNSTNLPGCIIANDIQTIIDLSKLEDIYVCGGASIYKQLLPYCDKLLITHILDRPKTEADVFFPIIDTLEFEITECSDVIVDNNFKTVYITYERRKNED